jgi:hypothetical protein
MISVKNDVISHQSFMRKTKLNMISALKKELANLKSDYLANSIRIQEQEARLCSLIDHEMRMELEKYRHYDILNMEKISPRFLTLAKIKSNKGSLDDIKTDRYNYIKNFYAGIYRDDRARELQPDAIEDFLGEDICNEPVVLHSKLTPEESLNFDTPLTINELDLAIQQLNEKSAGGADGVSTKFLKKFWLTFRRPLLNCINECVRKRELSQSFKGAIIRLY